MWSVLWGEIIPHVWGEPPALFYHVDVTKPALEEYLPALALLMALFFLEKFLYGSSQSLRERSFSKISTLFDELRCERGTTVLSAVGWGLLLLQLDDHLDFYGAVSG